LLKGKTFFTGVENSGIEFLPQEKNLGKKEGIGWGETFGQILGAEGF